MFTKFREKRANDEEKSLNTVYSQFYWARVAGMQDTNSIAYEILFLFPCESKACECHEFAKNMYLKFWTFIWTKFTKN